MKKEELINLLCERILKVRGNILIANSANVKYINNIINKIIVKNGKIYRYNGLIRVVKNKMYTLKIGIKPI